jgi:glycosyltransferase A (GT-A) superfamily protein (DUF2064 family)
MADGSQLSPCSGVIAFARLPVAGLVKTRLAADTGNENAREVYQACAEHILCEVSRSVSPSPLPLTLGQQRYLA